MYVCVHMDVRMCAHGCTYVCTWMYVCVHMDVRMCAHGCTYVCTWMYVCVHMDVRMCVHVYLVSNLLCSYKTHGNNCVHIMGYVYSTYVCTYMYM